MIPFAIRARRVNWRLLNANEELDLFGAPDIPAVERAWPPRYPLCNSPASQPVRLCDVKVPIGIGAIADPAGHRVIDLPVYEPQPRIRRHIIGNTLAAFLCAMGM